MQQIKSRFHLFSHWLNDFHIFISLLRTISFLNSFYLRFIAYFKKPWYDKVLAMAVLIITCFYIINSGYISYKYINFNISIRHVNDNIYFLNNDCANNPNDTTLLDQDRLNIRSAIIGVRDNGIALGTFLPPSMHDPIQQYILTGYKISGAKNICASITPGFNIESQRNNLLNQAHSILYTPKFYRDIFTDLFKSKKMNFYLPNDITINH